MTVAYHCSLGNPVRTSLIKERESTLLTIIDAMIGFSSVVDEFYKLLRSKDDQISWKDCFPPNGSNPLEEFLRFYQGGDEDTLSLASKEVRIEE